MFQNCGLRKEEGSLTGPREMYSTTFSDWYEYEVSNAEELFFFFLQVNAGDFEIFHLNISLSEISNPMDRNFRCCCVALFALRKLRGRSEFPSNKYVSNKKSTEISQTILCKLSEVIYEKNPPCCWWNQDEKMQFEIKQTQKFFFRYITCFLEQKMVTIDESLSKVFTSLKEFFRRFITFLSPKIRYFSKNDIFVIFEKPLTIYYTMNA